MEQKELEQLKRKLMKELKNVGIPISNEIEEIVINRRAKGRFGACKIKKGPLGKKKYVIEISEEIINCEIKALSAVIIHELLHTCKGCFNHGEKWKSNCKKVEMELGYEIKRALKYEDFGIQRPKGKEEIKYIVKCSGCGQEFPRKRSCNLVKYPERYRCSKCGNILYLKR